jgi:hypothetical protein
MTTPNASSLKARRVRNGALDKTAREISARRRAEGIRVLAAVHAAVPRAGDLEGRACGTVAVLTVAERAHVSGRLSLALLRTGEIGESSGCGGRESATGKFDSSAKSSRNCSRLIRGESVPSCWHTSVGGRRKRRRRSRRPL